MSRTISGHVGQSGTNNKADVKTIQEMLNKVFPNWGGPDPKLGVDGICGVKTIAAIRKFQQVQLATYFNPDGIIEPGKRTLQRLNHIFESSETPGGAFRVSAEPIAHVRQPTNMVCWAAAGTMLVSARDRISISIEDVMRRADTADPGYKPDFIAGHGYLWMFQNNRGLPPADTGRYTRALKLQVEPPVNFTVQGWRGKLNSHGALGVVGLTPFLHIRVVSEMTGDGTVFGTFCTVHDPGTSTPYTEVFQSFASKYEDAAFVNFKMDQIWHK